MKKYLNKIFKITVSYYIIYFLFTKINLGEVLFIFKKINFFFIFISLIIFLLCWLVSSRKWQIILRHLNIKEKISKLFKLNLISIFYASVLPGGQLTGESIKCFKTIKGSNKRGELFYSILMDKITGIIGFVILGYLGMIITNSAIINYNKIFNVFITAFIISILILFLFNKKIAGRIKKFFLKLFRNKNNKQLEKIIDIIFIFKGNYKLLSISLLYSLLFQFLNTLGVYFLTLALNINLSFIDLLWINALVSIVLILPITILGLGLREISFIYLLGILGIANTQALSLSLLVSFILLLLGAIGGFFELHAILFSKKLNSDKNL